MSASGPSGPLVFFIGVTKNVVAMGNNIHCSQYTRQNLNPRIIRIF